MATIRDTNHTCLDPISHLSINTNPSIDSIDASAIQLTPLNRWMRPMSVGRSIDSLLVPISCPHHHKSDTSLPSSNPIPSNPAHTGRTAHTQPERAMGKGKKRRHQPLAVEVGYWHSLNPIRLLDGLFHAHPVVAYVPDGCYDTTFPSSPHHPTIAPPQLDEDAREQREMELKRKRMLRRRTEGWSACEGGL